MEPILSKIGNNQLRWFTHILPTKQNSLVAQIWESVREEEEDRKFGIKSLERSLIQGDTPGSETNNRWPKRGKAGKCSAKATPTPDGI